MAAVQAGKVERVKGIEPSSKAWEAAVLPLNYTRISTKIVAVWCCWPTDHRGVRWM